jgi:hypothetical protein
VGLPGTGKADHEVLVARDDLLVGVVRIGLEDQARDDAAVGVERDVGRALTEPAVADVENHLARGARRVDRDAGGLAARSRRTQLLAVERIVVDVAGE